MQDPQKPIVVLILSSKVAPVNENVSFCRMLLGSLQYLITTTPDISFAINYVCQCMHQPNTYHFQMVKHILRYLKGIISIRYLIRVDSSPKLIDYSDSNWKGCKQTRISTTGLCTMLGNSVISWSAKRKTILARSST